MTNPLLRLLDLWSRRHVDGRTTHTPPTTRPAMVITGASEGIGLAIARRFARAGQIVVLVARRDALLQAAAERIRQEFQAQALALACDINRPEAAAEIDAALLASGLHVDILVNNAGFGLSGEFDAMPAADIEALLSCNIAALTRLSRHYLPQMIARGRGGLINIASLAGFAPGPYQAAYYASKAYVISLTRAIAYETSGTGVKVAVVTPGPVETSFHARMNAESSLYRYLVPASSPETVAAAAYRGFRWHRRIIAPGLVAKLLSPALQIIPHFLVIPVVAWLLYPRGTEAGRDTR